MTSTSPTTDNGRTVASMYEAFGRGDVAHVLAQMASDNFHDTALWVAALS